MKLFGGMFPYYASGKIVAGFGRGSADLGFPTGRTNAVTIRPLTGTISIMLNIRLPEK